MKKCESCGQQFDCGADEKSCWCEAMKVAENIPKNFKDCLCPNCLRQFAPGATEDFYYEGQNTVFTRAYHLKRGFCCESSEKGCRHCPYR